MLFGRLVVCDVYFIVWCFMFWFCISHCLPTVLVSLGFVSLLDCYLKLGWIVLVVDTLLVVYGSFVGLIAD